MISTPAHFGDELHDLVDKRLNANVRREVEAHLAGCAECRRRLDAIEWTKRALRSIPSARAPDHLRGEIERALRTERVEVALLAGTQRRWGSNVPIVIAIAILVGLAAVIANEFRSRPVTVPSLVAQDFRKLRAGDIELQLPGASPGVLAAYLAGYELPFPVRVLDPEPMGVALVGGGTTGRGEFLRALAVYRSPSGQWLACEILDGNAAGLPGDAIMRDAGGVRLHVYREGAIATVFWREGSSVFALVSDIHHEQLAQLAASQVAR